jgi:sulfate adenylyltransferase
MGLVNPHGPTKRLLPRLAPPEERGALLEEARGLPRIPLSSRETSDFIMLGIGAFTPLEGFMGAADWKSVTERMTLADGTFWPIPITLSADAATADAVRLGSRVALVDGESGDIMGTMTVAEKYAIDKAYECEAVFGTTDPAHPGVAKVLAQGAVNLAGPVTVLSEGPYPAKYPTLYLRPEETRDLFGRLGWSTVTAFQTRNPMHRSHEYLVKIALEVSDGVLIHQVLGKLKPGDIPAEVRVRAIDALVDHYFVPNTCIQAGYPMEMRYGGPREALLHAVIRQNFGCAYLIVGRDHAGVGNYYGPFDAQRIFDTLPPGALELKPLKIDWTFYCRRCDGMASLRTCPHRPEDRVIISGTRLRELLAAGEPVPDHFSRPEVLEILRAYYQEVAARRVQETP